MSVQSVSELYPRQWLRPDDLGGRAFTVKIISAVVQDFHQPADNTVKPAIVLTFERAQRRLILNKSQAMSLAEILGDSLAGWPGRSIALTPATGRTGKPTITIGEVTNGG